MNTKRIGRIAAASTLALVGVSALAVPAMADTSDGTEISDVQQAVGMPSAGTCTAVNDSTLNWAGVGGGGWSTGWGQWLNNGAGGLACVRTLTYNESTDTWSVAA